MSLGLPSHLAARVVSDGLARAARAASGICLALALLLFSLLRVETAASASAVLFAAFVLAGSALLILELRRSTLAAAFFVSAAGVAVAIATAVSTVFPESYQPAARFVVDLLWVACVVVGGPGRSRFAGALWTAVGFVIGAGGMLTGAVLSGAPLLTGIVPLLTAVVLAAFFLASGTSGARRIRLVLPQIQRATREEKLAEVRSEVEMRAAALLHDTVLGSLTAVANGPVGPLPRPLGAAIEDDLDAIIGQDWTASDPPPDDVQVAAALASVLADERAEGLTIVVTGKPEELNRLAPVAAEAVAQAARQLLVNVRRHSGVLSAEVVVMGHAGTVSVMVIDGGSGFHPEEVDADRLGIRGSVIARIEGHGGAVRIWSAPGRGTSVLLSVPVAPEGAMPGDSASADEAVSAGERGR